RSSTSTRRPPRARMAPVSIPPSPAPMMMTSQRIFARKEIKASSDKPQASSRYLLSACSLELEACSSSSSFILKQQARPFTLDLDELGMLGDPFEQDFDTPQPCARVLRRGRVFRLQALEPLQQGCFRVDCRFLRVPFTCLALSHLSDHG